MWLLKMSTPLMHTQRLHYGVRGCFENEAREAARLYTVPEDEMLHQSYPLSLNSTPRDCNEPFPCFNKQESVVSPMGGVECSAYRHHTRSASSHQQNDDASENSYLEKIDSNISCWAKTNFASLPSRMNKLRTTGGVDDHASDIAKFSGFNFAPPSGHLHSDYGYRDGAISQEEAHRKRLAFLHYVERRFPQQAAAMWGKAQYEASPLTTARSRASYAADRSYFDTTGSNQFYQPSDLDPVKSDHFSRGGRFRSSLPIVRSRNRSRESPLGVVYLEYSGESRAALLPNELTSLDTIRALFVQAYPGLLTMPMLNPPRHALLLKNRKNGAFDEINSVGDIKDRSTIRARPTGIPTPGNKKPAVLQKPKLDQWKKNNLTKQQAIDVATVTENNRKNNQKSGLKAPVTSLIRHYQGAVKPVAAEQGENKTSRKVPEPVPKPVKSRAPPPPPRTNKPSVQNAASKSPMVDSERTTTSPNGSLRSGNGLGGGSFPQKGFSYLSSTLSDSPTKKDSADDSVLSSAAASTVESDNASNVIANWGTERLACDTANVQESLESAATVQPRTYAGSSMASQTQFSSSAPLSADHSISKLMKKKGQDTRSRSASQLPKLPTNSHTAVISVRDASHQQQPSSVENKERVPAASNSPLYSRVNRSFKGNQPKPFNIPVVPDVSLAAPTSQSNASPVQTTSIAATSVTCSSFPATTDRIQDPPVPAVELAEKEKSKGNNSGRKGFFGLKKRSSNKLASGKSGSYKAKEKANAVDPKTALSNDAEAVDQNGSNFSTDSIAPPMQYPSHSEKPSKSTSITQSKKAVLPKSDLLHSLLSHKAERKGKDKDTGSVEFRDDFSATSSNSDMDRDSYSVANNSAGLTSVLKNSNLVKSASSSSILTDSGASNLSATPSIKTKKVSFHDNVTVCGGSEISTFSNSRRHPNLDARSVDEQSLSHDATDSDGAARYPSVSSDGSRPPIPWIEPLKDPVYPVEPLTYSTSMSGYSTGGYVTSMGHQSAVAAAIQTISSKPVVATYDGGAAGSAPVRPYYNYDRYAVSCASPVPLVTRQDRNASYKEDWDPYRRRIDPDVNSAPHAAVAQPRVCVTPRIGDVIKGTGMLSESSSDAGDPKELEPSYFQTHSSVNGGRDGMHSETPPYYECCTSAVQTQQINSKQLKDAPNQQTLPLCMQTSTAVSVRAPKSVDSKSNRMVAMERQIGNLAGKVESMIVKDSNTLAPPNDNNLDNRKMNSSSCGNQNSVNRRSSLRQQLLQLHATALELKGEMKDLKKHQQCNLEKMNEMVKEKTKEVVELVATTAGAQERPLRLRRMRLDEKRHTYGTSASLTEKQLSEVEAAVEELRSEVVERRCRVNTREVEALVLQLSQAGRTIAQLKGVFPSLCEEIRTVAAAETEVIYAEEKFSEGEPVRLDEQLKRCKQLTSTLYTLKKLASVQEARSKTPTPSAQLRPTTPSLPGSRGLPDDPNLNRKRVLNDVKRMKVDNNRRMESIQDAEVSWSRRRKFILEHDSKKLEKALEMAEKALNRTDYISLIDQKQKAQLVEIYKNREATGAAEESNLTTSESSSVESLSPPSDPAMRSYSAKAPLPPGHGFPLPPEDLRLPPSDLKIPSSSGNAGFGVISPDVGYLSSDHSPVTGRVYLPPTNTGSLPRHANSTAYRIGYGAQPHPGVYKSNPAGSHLQYGRPMERSRSVTPRHWVGSGLEASNYSADFGHGYEAADERQRFMEQQQMVAVEKNKKLKDQYSKLVQMQKRQRISMKKHPATNSKPLHHGMHHQQMPISPAGPKSSDV